VEGVQFSVWYSTRERIVGEKELTVVPEDAYGVIRRRGGRGSRVG